MDFETLREQGQFVHASHWLAVSYKSNDHGCLRWGWTLSRKVGSSVVRNRLRRWGREFLSEFKETNLDINFIFKAKGSEFYKNLSREEFNRVFGRLFKSISR